MNLKGTREELESRDDINIVLMYEILKKYNLKTEFAFQNPFMEKAVEDLAFDLIY